MPTENSEIAFERMISKTATADTAGLASLLEDANTVRLIDQVSKWAERNYKHDREDIRQALFMKLYTQIDAIRNPRALDLWLYSVAKNYCLDESRRQKSESTAAKRNSTQPQEPLTPEYLLREKEVLRRLRLATRSLPAEIEEIVDRWVRGESAKKIANETRKSIKTIYRILTRYKKALIEQVTREQQDPGPDGMRVEAGSSTEQILLAMERLDAAELEKLVPRAIALGAARKAPHLKPEESKLLARANDALPPELTSRLSKLQKKRHARSLSAAEFEELISLSDRVEQLHAERLQALADLARLRGTTLTDLMDQLGIRFPENA
jgi:RNA polymerase sigma factor (sigma-70 family)